MVAAIDSSGLDTKINVYNPDYVVAAIVSIVLFILFFISQTIDFNRLLIDFGATDGAISKSRLIYIYIAGYFIYILKLLLAIFYIFILIAMIVVILVLLIGLLKVKVPKAAGVTGVSGADDLITNMKSSVYKRVEYSIRVIAVYIFGFVSIKQFMLVFLVCIPLFLFFYYLYYALIIYNPKSIANDQPDKVGHIMNTNHHFLLFLFVTLAVISIIYLFYLYTYDLKLASK